MRRLLPYIILFAMTVVGCHDNELGYENDIVWPPEKPELFDRTVLVYVMGENNLSSYVSSELKELRAGSVGIGNNALIVYVDKADSKVMPYILWIRDGQTADSCALDYDPISSDPVEMKRILDYTSSNYPAKEYGLVLWGHASGWHTEDSVKPTERNKTIKRAYGTDNGRNASTMSGKWINIPSLRQTLSEWKHLKYIFADCCQFQCIESAYELRNVTDYIIASPAEIPNEGAPYHTVAKGLFDPSDMFYKTIVDNYFEQVIPFKGYIGSWSSLYYDIEARTPLSVIKTSELDQLATATHQALQSFLPQSSGIAPNLLTEKLIYYRGNTSSAKETVMYDMNDFMLHYATPSAYSNWKTAFEQAVIYKVNANDGWITSGQILPYVFGQDGYGNATTPILTNERYGGISMFVPQDRAGSWYMPYQSNGVNFQGYNNDIKRTSWYDAAGLSAFGW